MECMHAQTGRQFILSSERVFREWSQNLCELQGKISHLPEAQMIIVKLMVGTATKPLMIVILV